MTYMGYAAKPVFCWMVVAIGWFVLVDAPSATEAGNSGSSTATGGSCRSRYHSGLFFFFPGKKSQGNKIDPNSVIKGAFIYFKICSC